MRTREVAIVARDGLKGHVGEVVLHVFKSTAVGSPCQSAPQLRYDNLSTMF